MCLEAPKRNAYATYVACFHSISAEGAPGLIVRASFGYTHDMHISRDPELELEPGAGAFRSLVFPGAGTEL